MNKKLMTMQLEASVAEAVLRQLDKTHEDIAAQFGITANYLRRILKARSIAPRKRGKGSPAWKYKQSLVQKES